jgi:hypothetical protein
MWIRIRMDRHCFGSAGSGLGSEFWWKKMTLEKDESEEMFRKYCFEILDPDPH